MKHHKTPSNTIQNADSSDGSCQHITLMGSGAILTEVIQAAELLAARGITAHVISVTSWSELARNSAACHTGSRPDSPSSLSAPWAAQMLRQTQGPVIAATDYVRAVRDSIRAYLPPSRSCTTQGTDGFGRSDTIAALRTFFWGRCCQHCGGCVAADACGC
ncbi:MAG: hypothetical protein H7Z77_10885 [Chitinophagaceae bacterium]|nr:hypothetical protein [Polaromonas sp.]